MWLRGVRSWVVDKELENGIHPGQLSRLMLRAAVRIAKDDRDTAYLSLLTFADFLRGAARLIDGETSRPSHPVSRRGCCRS